MAYNSHGKSNTFVVGQDNRRDNNWTLYFNIANSIPSSSTDPGRWTTIYIDKNSFKNPGMR